MAYGQAFRKRVLALYDRGLPTKEVAERLGVSRSYCRRVKQHRHRPPAKLGGRQPKLKPSAREHLRTWIAQQPDATLEELRARIASELQIQISLGALWSTLRQMQLSFKKSR
jgi:transposase